MTPRRVIDRTHLVWRNLARRDTNQWSKRLGANTSSFQSHTNLCGSFRLERQTYFKARSIAYGCQKPALWGSETTYLIRANYARFITDYLQHKPFPVGGQTGHFCMEKHFSTDKSILNQVLNFCVAPFEAMKSVKALVDEGKSFSISFFNRENYEKKCRGEEYGQMFSFVASGEHNACVMASPIGSHATHKRFLPYFIAEIIAEHGLAASIVEITDEQAEALILLAISSVEMAQELDDYANSSVTDEGEQEMKERAIEVCALYGYKQACA